MRSRSSVAKSKAAAVLGEPPPPDTPPPPDQPRTASGEQQDFFGDPIPRDRRSPDPQPDKPPQAGGGQQMTGYERVIDRLFTVDVDAVYEQLEADLRLATKASRADYGTIVDALDVAEDNARLAMQLCVHAKVTRDAFLADLEVTESALREEATAIAQAQKEKGERSKAITNADIDAIIAARHSEEWRDLKDKRARAQRTCEYLERLAELWKERAKDLRAMVAKARDA